MQDASTADEVRAIFQQAREGAFDRPPTVATVATVAPAPEPVPEPVQVTPGAAAVRVSVSASDPVGQLAAALAMRLDAMTETRLRELRTLVLDAIGAE